MGTVLIYDSAKLTWTTTVRTSTSGKIYIVPYLQTFPDGPSSRVGLARGGHVLFRTGGTKGKGRAAYVV